MFKKLNKTQMIIFISIIIFIILLIFGIVFCINKFNKNDIKDTGIKMAEEITDITTDIESSSAEIKSKETTKEESTTTNKETETETNKSQNIETSEAKTNAPTHPATVAPTQPQTEVKTKPATQPQTSSQPVTQPQYYDTYTGQPISKEEYDSIMNEMNNPEPTTTQAPQENVYVLNDDGTINFKKSKIYGDSMDEILLNYILNSHEFQNHFAGKNIIHISGQNGMITHYIIYCHIKLENGELITFHFDENWNIIKD